jgi:acetyltransferase-like isoleucine patch superfamily enzyme
MTRAIFNRWRRRLVHALQFRTVFGERSQGRWLPHTRISASTCIEFEHRLTLGDHVYIGHFNLIEASGGVVIEEGVQITNHVSIVTHSSHRTQRLLGRAFVTWPKGVPPPMEAPAPPERDWITDRPVRRGRPVPDTPPGWIAGPVHIGAYCFIGPHSLIEANSRLGRGCIVCAGSQVRGEFTEFSILEGAPARVIGDARRADQRLLMRHPELHALYEAWAGEPGGRR